MYCTKCGKQIDYDALVCKECCEKEREALLSSTETETAEEKAQAYYSPVPTAPAASNESASYAAADNGEMYPDPDNRMFGFGKALTATILGFVGFLFSYIGLIFTAIIPAVGIVFFVISAAPSIISVIFGISSIKCFARRKSHCAKPIATLILGIAGLAQGAFACFFLFIILALFATV